MAQDLSLTAKCINTIRLLAADTVQKAKSGHPGAPMGLAPLAHMLWGETMKYDPVDPKWPGRDRFVLSNGHACALQYSMLHLSGYPSMTLEDLKNFRQLNSKTPGHPESHITEGIEVTTGPLGQGISNAVGLAIAETHLAALFNKPGFDIVNNYTYVVCGDGCLQEGVAAEACSLAGHLKLGKLILFYDDNNVTIDGFTELSFTENVLKRFESYGWHTQCVENGNTENLNALRGALQNAQFVKDKPSIISVKTIIGYGSAKQGTEKVHGAPLGDDDITKAKKLFGFNPEQKFFIPEEVSQFYSSRKTVGKQAHDSWNDLFSQYQKQYPAEAAEFQRLLSGNLPKDWAACLPTFKPSDPAKGTRNYSQAVLEKLVPTVPELIGGSADLTPSNLTQVKGNSVDYAPVTREGRYFRFGVREHGMAAICNGIAAYVPGLIPFCASFLTFTGYALGAIRLSALSHLRVLYIMTHDSIGLGEDGPTHQPVEILSILRAIPNLLVLRPADGNESSGSYKAALEHIHTPSVLCFSRQATPNLEGTSIDSVMKGAYVIREVENAQITLTGSGTELGVVVQAADILKGEGINARVVSFPCFELFEDQPEDYKLSVFTPNIPVLSHEANVEAGWERYSHAHLGMTSFGSSGPYEEVYKYFGLTAQDLASESKKVIEFYKSNPVPNLIHRLKLGPQRRHV